MVFQLVDARTAINDLLYKELGSLSKLSENERGPGCIVLKNSKLSLGEKCSAKVKSKYRNFASELKVVEDEVSYFIRHFSESH